MKKNMKYKETPTSDHDLRKHPKSLVDDLSVLIMKMNILHRHLNQRIVHIESLLSDLSTLLCELQSVE